MAQEHISLSNLNSYHSKITSLSQVNIFNPEERIITRIVDPESEIFSQLLEFVNGEDQDKIKRTKQLVISEITLTQEQASKPNPILALTMKTLDENSKKVSIRNVIFRLEGLSFIKIL